MAEPQLFIQKFDEDITLTVTNHQGGVAFCEHISNDAFEVLKKGLHAEHEIDITRAILESAFPGDDEDDDLPLCEEGL